MIVSTLIRLVALLGSFVCSVRGFSFVSPNVTLDFQLATCDLIMDSFDSNMNDVMIVMGRSAQHSNGTCISEFSPFLARVNDATETVFNYRLFYGEKFEWLFVTYAE